MAMDEDFSWLEANYNRVRHLLGEALATGGRTLAEVELVAVSKTQDLSLMLELYRLGHRIFGENRVQEALGKKPDLPTDAQIHMIGHLQSNKAKQVPGLFTLVHSLDSFSASQALDRAFSGGDKTFPVLLEMNTSQEESKTGVSGLEELKLLAEKVMEMKNLEILGLMTMAPFTQDQGLIRSCFRSLYEAREKLRVSTGLGLPHLSMGMSNDYLIGAQEGATILRVGTAIFSKPQGGA